MNFYEKWMGKHQILIGVGLFLLYMPAAFANPEFSLDAQYEIVFKVKLHAVDHETESSRLKVIVYAYDKILADVPASHLKTAYFQSPVQGKNHTVQFSGVDLKNALEAYYAQVGGHFDSDSDEHMAGFYFVWQLDLDGDGQFCAGDLGLDYQQTGETFHSVKPGSKGMNDLMVAHFKVAKEIPCTDF